MGSKQSKPACTKVEESTKPTISTQSTQSTQTSEEKYKKIRYAVLGSEGSRKSAFINAIRRLRDDDERAAKVDAETTMKPTEYNDLTSPLISFCDLPSYDSPNLENHDDMEIYWNKFELDGYDRFLIITSVNLTDFDVALCEKVEAINKPFFLICNKIDSDFCHSDEERELANIKDSLMKQTKDLRCKEEDIFLIISGHPDKGDFARLHQAVYNSKAVPCIELISDLTEEYMSDVREHIEKHGVANLDEFLKEKLERSKNVKIKFAIIGNIGVGKSAFINAIRGLDDDDEKAAEVSNTEERIQPTEYKHPDNQMISLWDLPGFGGPGFSDFDNYCEAVNLTTYDTFLIFTRTRFTENDLKLANKVKSIRKSFFLIRSNIDVDCMPKKGKGVIKEEKILHNIRQDIMKNVKDMISSEKDVFLIGNYDKDKWDFDRLIKAISDALPMVQRECLTLSLGNLTRGCLQRKAKFLKAEAVVVAALSGATGAIPIPAVAPVVDIALISATIYYYYRAFGLHKVTSKELNSMKQEKIKQIIERYGMNAHTELIARGAFMAVDEIPKLIPIVGSIIASGVYFGSALYRLVKSINEMEEAALAVWDNAEKRSN